MKFPWYSVSIKFFNGLYYAPMHEGFFDTLEEAKDRYDSIKLEGNCFGVYVVEFHEDSCIRLFSKEREIKQPDAETMERPKYITKAEIAKRKKGVENA